MTQPGQHWGGGVFSSGGPSITNLQGTGLDPSIRDVPLCPHLGKKCFVLTYVVLDQILILLSNLFRIYKKEDCRSRRQAAQGRSICSPFIR